MHALPPTLEAEIAGIRRDPLDAVGFGEKAFIPYELRQGGELVRSPDPAVTARLLDEARDSQNDRVARLAMLQVMAQRDDPAVDAALTSAVADPILRPLAGYLLGRIGFKGYPKRERASAPLLRALAPHLEDTGTFDDPWYGKSLRTGDLVLGAFIRIAGPGAFDFAGPGDATYVGYTVLPFADAARRALLAQAKAFRIPD
jgi:hypothetical protein